MFLRFALNRTITEEAHVRHDRPHLQDYTKTHVLPVQRRPMYLMFDLD